LCCSRSSASLDVAVSASGFMKGELTRTEESESDDDTSGDCDEYQEVDSEVEESEEEEKETKGDAGYEEREKDEGEKKDGDVEEKTENTKNKGNGEVERKEEEERKGSMDGYGVAEEIEVGGGESVRNGGVVRKSEGVGKHNRGDERSDEEEGESRKDGESEEERVELRTSDVSGDSALQQTIAANARTEGDIRRLVRRGLEKKRKNVVKGGGRHAKAKENKRVAAGGQRRTKKGSKMKIKEMTSVGLF